MINSPVPNAIRASAPCDSKTRALLTSTAAFVGRFAAMCAMTLGLTTGTASAAVVSFSTNFEVETDYSGTLVGGVFSIERSGLQLASLSRFDPALGTLTGVTFGFYSTVALDLLGSALDSNPGQVAAIETFLAAELAVDLALSLFDPSPAANYGVTRRIADECSIRGGPETVLCQVSKNQVLGLSEELVLAPGVALNDFVGVDPINFFASMGARLTGACQDDIGDDCEFAERTGATWSGVATVAYTYNAAGGPGTGIGGGGTGNSVPEPPSLALLALGGLGLLGAARARRRS